MRPTPVVYELIEWLAEYLLYFTLERRVPATVMMAAEGIRPRRRRLCGCGLAVDAACEKKECQ